MSAFAGIFFRRAVDDREHRIQQLRRTLLMHASTEHWEELPSHHSTMWKYDFDAFGASQTGRATQHGTTVVAGHPYFDTVSVDDRTQHVTWLLGLLRRHDLQQLAHARGSYAFAYSPAARRELILGTDCLGVRPLYYIADGNCVVFSTVLRILETIPGFDTTLDERGAIEEGALGFCLGDRTRYAVAKCLLPGHIALFGDTGETHRAYWEWVVERTASFDEQHARRAVYDSFQDAVRLRLANDQRSMGFLTGGLDSRCVIAAVRQHRAAVNTLNFAPLHSQDLLFGAQLAKALGTNHLELAMPPASVDSKVPSVMPQWIAYNESGGLVADRPRLVWSGDGGSVGLGHVFLTDAMIDAIEDGDVPGAIDLLLAEHMSRVPRRLLPAKRAKRLAQIPSDGLRETLDKIRGSSPGRRLHVLLMLTDQRRHLHSHFERIFDHQCELHLPFFDRGFLECLFSYPVRPFVGHRFYNKWLELFPEAVRVVPWQAYPGHEPCRLPVPPDLIYQWDASVRPRAGTASARRADAVSTLGALWRGDCDHRLVDTKKLALISILTYLGVGDYQYALKFARVLTKGSK